MCKSFRAEGKIHDAQLVRLIHTREFITRIRLNVLNIRVRDRIIYKRHRSIRPRSALPQFRLTDAILIYWPTTLEYRNQRV